VNIRRAPPFTRRIHVGDGQFEIRRRAPRRLETGVDALREGMQEKSAEFKKTGEIYVKQ